MYREEMTSVTDAIGRTGKTQIHSEQRARVRGVIKNTGLEELREAGTSIEVSITLLLLRNCFKMGQIAFQRDFVGER